jgi:hypothetical protein
MAGLATPIWPKGGVSVTSYGWSRNGRTTLVALAGGFFFRFLGWPNHPLGPRGSGSTTLKPAIGMAKTTSKAKWG